MAVLARPNISQLLSFSTKSLAEVAYPRYIISCFPFFSNLVSDPEPYQPSNICLPEGYHPCGLLWVSLTNSTGEAWIDHDMDLEYNVCYSIKRFRSRTVLDRFRTFLEFLSRFVSTTPDKTHDGVGTVYKSISHSRRAIATSMLRLLIRLKPETRPPPHIWYLDGSIQHYQLIDKWRLFGFQSWALGPISSTCPITHVTIEKQIYIPLHKSGQAKQLAYFVNAFEQTIEAFSASERARYPAAEEYHPHGNEPIHARDDQSEHMPAATVRRIERTLQKFHSACYAKLIQWGPWQNRQSAI
ncbi:hypothetical protein ACJ73_08969 [Blastomyces percursus]|uniref:Uncharacterized protein n=1 Tax=Blastomyces percursus TaxID=1658174 RepID=A0A1J9QHG1_9EURO|nr:hypothetical protein ACJ73_08969 [Blastomyces percursus]